MNFIKFSASKDNGCTKATFIPNSQRYFKPRLVCRSYCSSSINQSRQTTLNSQQSLFKVPKSQSNHNNDSNHNRRKRTINQIDLPLIIANKNKKQKLFQFDENNNKHQQSFESDKQTYFIIPAIGADHVAIMYKDNKYISNGDYKQKDGTHAFYWRCNKYEQQCHGKMITYKYPNVTYSSEQRYGDIGSITDHSIQHQKTWTADMASKSICLGFMKNCALNKQSDVQNYKRFQRLYPMQSIQHFCKYNDVRRFLQYHSISTKTPKDRTAFILLLNHTEHKYNFWKYIIESDKYQNKTWHDIEKSYIENHPATNYNIHPDVQIDEDSQAFIDIENQKTLLDIKQQYHMSRIISDNLPDIFKSDMYLGSIDGNVILQSKHGGYRLSHSVVNLVNIDGTFTKPFGQSGTLYEQLIFINAQIDAPDSGLTHKQYPCALMLLKSKQDDTYKKVFNLFKQLNESKYGYKFTNIKHISSDMESALYKRAQQCIFTEAKLLFCFFHYMQANFRKAKNIGLFGVIRTNKPVYKAFMLYLYAAFINSKYVKQYQSHVQKELCKRIPAGHKLKIKQYLKYNIAQYSNRLNINWWNCCHREKLQFTNNPSERFNREWKNLVTKRPNILKILDAWRCIDANATVDFETHIKNPSNTKNFNKKLLIKQKRDKEIIAAMKNYNGNIHQHDSLGIDYHIRHGQTILNLMKSWNDPLQFVSLDDDNDDDDAVTREDVGETCTMRPLIMQYMQIYPTTDGFLKYNTNNEKSCKKFMLEIKESDKFNEVLQAHQLSNTKNPYLKYPENTVEFKGPYDYCLIGAIIVLKVSGKWYPGVVVDLESNYCEIFLPLHVHYQRLLKLDNAKGKIRLL